LKIPHLHLIDWLRRVTVRLRSKVTIPLVRWTVSWWLLLGLPGLFGIAVIGGAVTTHTSVFCMSCHEMGAHYENWRVSSHKDVGCEECHIMPGFANMLRSKMSAARQVRKHVKGDTQGSAIQAHVPDANCRKCHPETRDLVVYHGLKITHKQHWDRGIECTVCHSRVVHGPNAAIKNTPRMSTCFQCHDGKKAPNNCGLCHETLGVRRPTVFSPEWVEGHKIEVSRGEDSCKRCHQEDFCVNCHRMATPHTGDWIHKHPAQAGRSLKSCETCHARDFCVDCHKRYQAHTKGWLQMHPGQAKMNPENCKTCHEEQFCMKCHKTQRPGSHQTNWLKLHPIQAKMNLRACNTCHTKDACKRCHGIAMPHPSQFRSTHMSMARSNRLICQRCHDQQYCASCHRGSRPSSHKSGWVKNHGQVAKGSTECSNCHTKTFCTACHSGTMPVSHGGDWRKKHGNVAQKSATKCANCHSKQSCDNCHGGVQMPHPANWVMEHKNAEGVSRKADSKCFQCHESSSCKTCHQDG